MGISGKVMEALKAGILLNERLTTLIDKVDRMDNDLRQMNGRVIRLETMVEIARSQPRLPDESE
ncbi:MAG: hypothetical protein DSY58_09355 [Desulfobulbus sp.]|nr:MAG: hypothetical protein DSY58_09355 [Desulfobulbus sp.]RUM40683.1 MAG: hypothetical protein DSY70_03035 [Desulfobulbus sp.]